ncbi:MAG TPA: hypothetical protein VJ824_07505 [Bacillota bacterium]|nr:hypothetical protein [Bacillota bacterium]
MDNLVNKWKQILQVAATYIGTVVGAGFATGREVVEFFARFEWNGLLGIMVASFLFIWLGTKMMILSAKIDAYSFQDLINYLSGKRVGGIFNFFMLLILLGVTSVMISGAGAIFHEQLGLSYLLGAIVTVILCYFVMTRGLSGVLTINSIVVPLMVFFSLLIAVNTIQHYTHVSIPLGVIVTFNFSTWEWILRSLTYASLNLCLAQAVLVPLGRDIKDEKILKWGGILGGIGLCLMLFCANFALMSLKENDSYEIPMAEIIRNFGSVIHLFFLFVIYGEIFTTLVGNVFGITRQMYTLTQISEKILGGFFLLFCLLVSQIGFGTLISYLYPLFGYIGSFFLLLLIFRGKLKVEK